MSAADPIGLTKAIEPPARIDASELGVIASTLFRNFITGETISVNPVSYRELRRITDEDGQARGLLRLLTMPIVNSKWDVLIPEEDSTAASSNEIIQNPIGNKSSPERDFIAKNLFSPSVEGGMSIPFDEVLAVMALAIRDGFKAFEKVFALNERGQVILQKLARRENDTVILKSDEHGDFDGFRQVANFGGKSIDVTILKEKALLYTFAKEENPLYGSPLFLPVYYHMDKKHKLYYISHIAYQQLAVPSRWGTYPAGSDKAVIDKFLANIGSLGFNAAVTFPDTFTVEGFESKRAMADFIPLIDHHNMMATKAVLAQFMDLNRSSTGRLAGEQQDVFDMGFQRILKDIEKQYNNWVIPQLIDFNFSSKVYPKLRARPFTDSDQVMLREIFKDIMTSGANHASPEFMARLEQRMASQIDIKGLDYTQIEKDMVKRTDAMTQPFPPGGGNTNTDPTQGRAPKGSGFGKEGNA